MGKATDGGSLPTHQQQQHTTAGGAGGGGGTVAHRQLVIGAAIALLFTVNLMYFVKTHSTISRTLTTPGASGEPPCCVMWQAMRKQRACCGRLSAAEPCTPRRPGPGCAPRLSSKAVLSFLRTCCVCCCVQVDPCCSGSSS